MSKSELWDSITIQKECLVGVEVSSEDELESANPTVQALQFTYLVRFIVGIEDDLDGEVPRSTLNGSEDHSLGEFTGPNHYFQILDIDLDCIWTEDTEEAEGVYVPLSAVLEEDVDLSVSEAVMEVIHSNIRTGLYSVQ